MPHPEPTCPGWRQPMPDPQARQPPLRRDALTWRTLVAVILCYTGAVLVASYPVVRTFSTKLPVADFRDPLQALWVMRWYKDSLLHGHDWIRCPDLQAPIG